MTQQYSASAPRKGSAATETSNRKFLVLAATALGAAIAISPSAEARSPGIAASLETHDKAGLLPISAEEFKVGNISGPPGQPLEIDIKLPPNPTVTYSFLMFRNMPPKFSLSAGFGAKDYWAVSLHDVDRLKMLPTEDYNGSFVLEVLLVKGMGSDPERRTAQVSFGGRSAPAVASRDDRQLLTAARPEESTSAIPPLNPTGRQLQPKAEPAAPQQLSAIDESMMQRGDAYVKQGDIAAARLLYRQLAKKGIASGALAMGNTYDPEFLATLPVRGLQPDIEQAKNWYRMAEELGSAQAARRLSALNGQRN